MANVRSALGQSKVGWEFFGTELKRRREVAGYTQERLGHQVFCSGSYIGQLEAAIRKPQLDLAQRIDAVLKTDGFFERMCRELIDSSPYQHYFAEAAYLEGLADTIREYAPVFMPGLLQTAAYARAVVLASVPHLSDDEVEARVRARLERQRILEDPTKPLLWVVLHENVIRCKVGGAACMSEQLLHAAALARKRRITLQVLPYEAGAPALAAMVTLMTFEDAPPVAYSEGAHSGCLVDTPERVTGIERAYDRVRAAALSPDASLALVQSVAEEYAHEC
ncbi:helix-turn-helix transcriptional regulator [Streptomyces sp. UNOC14_S4]|uniref:helix-turn-helix domain-containing protein n=1 Tax=Streptomyces sp. UNOC14_S4 TaxID=2872340 RepID=UPI001E31C2D7|nr:helix-turn-helix transcriptional regulator [Streptomyces sp. UNOC14_S4]MCC3770795.1 helix-turn-helix transcriptional regulator [Streptomyces sp. UNOC14_S4]